MTINKLWGQHTASSLTNNGWNCAWHWQMLTCFPLKKRRCLSGSALKWSTNFSRRSSIFVNLLKLSMRTLFCPSMLLTCIHILTAIFRLPGPVRCKQVWSGQLAILPPKVVYLWAGTLAIMRVRTNSCLPVGNPTDCNTRNDAGPVINTGVRSIDIKYKVVATLLCEVLRQ